MNNAHLIDDTSTLDWPGVAPMNQGQAVASEVSDPAAQEWRVRVDLAACYRLVDLFG